MKKYINRLLLLVPIIAIYVLYGLKFIPSWSYFPYVFCLIAVVFYIVLSIVFWKEIKIRRTILNFFILIILILAGLFRITYGAYVSDNCTHDFYYNTMLYESKPIGKPLIKIKSCETNRKEIYKHSYRIGFSSSSHFVCYEEYRFFPLMSKKLDITRKSGERVMESSCDILVIDMKNDTVLSVSTLDWSNNLLK